VLATVAQDVGIPVFTSSRDEVYSAFDSMGFSNKQMLAVLIAKHIPAFERHIPPPRKPWISEDARGAVRCGPHSHWSSFKRQVRRQRATRPEQNYCGIDHFGHLPD
jgi:hypothetical protein